LVFSVPVTGNGPLAESDVGVAHESFAGAGTTIESVTAFVMLKPEALPAAASRIAPCSVSVIGRENPRERVAVHGAEPGDASSCDAPQPAGSAPVPRRHHAGCGRAPVENGDGATVQPTVEPPTTSACGFVAAPCQIHIQ